MRSLSVTAAGCCVFASLALLPCTSRPAFAADFGPQTASETRAAVDGRELEGLIQRYATDRVTVERFYDLPWSELRFARLERFYDAAVAQLAAIDFASLGQRGRIDYLLLRNHVEAERARIARDRRRLAQIEELLPFRKAALELDYARRRMEPVDAPAGAEALAGFIERIKTVRERIERGREAPATQEAPPADSEAEKQAAAPLAVTPVVASRAASAVDALRGTLHDWFSFYDGYQPEFSWWVRKPYEEAGQALEEYARFLRETVAGTKGADDDPLIGEPIGAAALAEELAWEVLPYSPEELIAIGEREFAWCEAEMRKAAAQMGFGDDWHAALAKVKQDHVPPGQQDDLMTAEAREAIRFVKERELVTIPPLCEETWRLTMISPEEQKFLPFAAYGGQDIKVAYAAESMDHDDKLMSMRGNNRHFSRAVALHELIPGHHLQAFTSRRVLPYRELFATPFFFEGWALYWEMTFWDLGYPRTPEERVGMLFWRMHRAARIIVSLKFHLGTMTPEQMVDFLVERVGHERFGALGEVRRYIAGGYSALYQCSYMVGGLQVRALRRELVDSGKMDERAFHDALLTHGVIPIELVRAAMLNVPLTPDYRAGWRFTRE